MTAPGTALARDGNRGPEVPSDSDETATAVHSHLFGPLTVEQDDSLFFPDGLLGFPECRRYVLVDAGLLGLYWLQSLDHGALVFLLVDPFVFVDGYSLDIGDTELTHLDPADASELAVLAIVTLPDQREEHATANLQGPIAFNPQRRIGRQVVISDSPYGVRCPVELPQIP